MTYAPEVTVVIPTRDRWPILSACALPSALSQAAVDLEVIVVDDGSREKTAEQIRPPGDPRVRLLRHDQSQGVSAARNLGIAAARGEWIAFLDDDDLWSPLKLRRQLDCAAATDAEVIYTGVIEIDDDAHPLHTTAPETTSLSDLLAWNTIPAGSSTVLARSEHVRAADGFDARLAYMADWDLWIRLAQRARLAVVPEILVAYVRHGRGMEFAGRRAIDEMRYFVEKHEATGLRVDPAVYLWWIATDHRLDAKRRAAASIYFRTALAYRRPRRVLRAFISLLDPRGRRRLRARAARLQPPVSVARDVPWLQEYR
jgi:glycosyltransferase involved in cell wall biosynthesis